MYQVAVERVDLLRKRLDSLGRRAARLGVGSISYEIGPEFAAAYVHGTTTGWVRWDWLNDPAKLAELPKRFRQFCFVKLTATTPRCEGWEFVATLQHLWDEEAKQGINLLRCSPQFEGALPVHFRTATAAGCDHCNRAIMTRKDTFVVHNPTTDEWEQVGRSCRCDFLGGHDPHGVARMLEYGLEASTVCGEDEEDKDPFGGGSHRLDGVGITEFLAQTAACCRLEGWLSRGKARLADCGPSATANLVLYLQDPPPSNTKARADWDVLQAKFAPQPVDIEQASKALDYAREQLGDKGDARSDFEHNLYVAIVQPCCTRRTAGITAYLIPYYLKEVERATLREAEVHLAADSQHFGEVGRRYADLYVRLLKVIQIDGNYGTTYLHRLVTREGNVAVWFASSCPGMQQGVEYRVAATVKRHDTRDGAAQTTLTRVTVFTDEGRAQAEAKEAKKAAKGTVQPVVQQPEGTVQPAGPSEAQQAAGERYRQQKFERKMRSMRDNYLY
jgi:hypothetical protein